MARRGRRKTRGSTGLIIGSLSLIALSLGIIGAFAFLKMQASGNIALDKGTLCPVTGPTSVTAVLFDTTDPITPTTQRDLKNQFQKIIAALPVGDLLEIYNMTDHPGELQSVFSGCNPGDGSTISEWTSNPRLARKRWEEAFDKPLRTLEERIGNNQQLSQSPIMADIQKVKIQLFDKPGIAAVRKSLIIASDMIEHTAAYSQYKSGIDYHEYEASSAKREYRTDLDGVGVTILYFERRSSKFNPKDHIAFWDSWVSGNRGEILRVTRLEGLN